MPLLTDSLPSLFLQSAMALKAEETRLNKRVGFPKYDRCKINFVLDAIQPTASIWARIPCTEGTIGGSRAFFPINYLASDSVDAYIVEHLISTVVTIGVTQTSNPASDFSSNEFRSVPISFELAIPVLPDINIPANGIDRRQYRVNISVIDGYAVITALLPVTMTIVDNGLAINAIDYFAS